MTPAGGRRLTWVVGGGGLLGQAVRAELSRRGASLFEPPPVPWSSPERSSAALVRASAELATEARRAGIGWRILWCAGSGVTGTAQERLDAEVRAFSALLDAMAEHTDVPGSLFMASSAGGVYAGAPEPPFTEAHPVAPISAYGWAKLAQEEAARRFSQLSGVPTVVGRIANLYGPGQDLSKAQGLVSHVCRSYLTGQPVSIYVPLDTVRDYLYVDDAAAIVVDSLMRAEAAGPGSMTVKIIASQQGTTVGALLGDCHRVLKRMPRVVLGSSPNARLQARDLRLRSTVWRELDQRALTPLPAGLHATCTGLLRSIQRGTRT